MPETAPLMRARTMFDKIWDSHEIIAGCESPSLLYIDRDIIHEGSFHAFAELRRRGLSVRYPQHVFGMADHYVPTHSRDASAAASPEIAHMIHTFDDNLRWAGITNFSLAHPRQGIVHVAGPEMGITLPGQVVVCSDSHTSTHGALGAIAFGIGQSENAHVLATQALWQRRPKTMRITISGKRSPEVSAKDVILSIISRIGSSGATGYAIEYAGTVIDEMSIEERLTICNMSIEAGARCGMVAPDDKTFSYLRALPYSPVGKDWDTAVAYWKTLPTDEGAGFDHEIELDGTQMEPTVTWGTSPEDALPISGRVPDPGSVKDAARRAAMEAAQAYMGLRPGQRLDQIRIDQVFIGSCTNGRIEDLRAVAQVMKGRKAAVPAIVVPGSTAVKRAAEAEGLDRIFKDAGLLWLESGCSMCAAMNGDVVAPGKRCASTSNRNFVGRQGPGSRTHLMSPAMAAAAAVTGKLTDVRTLLEA
ncbi:3-isopropylmalate dehydratase large subunit [Allopusillimonas ginsengisoli]|uniref:3-isopropylmalate dehydratase large subunit n=1 Tax=Allopusillimonas ginsengisoli TaxID=453575 RepID=UPI0010228C27|nr:3-isopropylmalate dehydratase large subunit [Allopusillimonas ginsengisoli]TEA78813.1 3-isopropylmalate dehydratase large subunit [Allopusillimonas ginsengisoli]